MISKTMVMMPLFLEFHWEMPPTEFLILMVTVAFFFPSLFILLKYPVFCPRKEEISLVHKCFACSGVLLVSV